MPSNVQVWNETRRKHQARALSRLPSPSLLFIFSVSASFFLLSSFLSPFLYFLFTYLLSFPRLFAWSFLPPFFSPFLASFYPADIVFPSFPLSNFFSWLSTFFYILHPFLPLFRVCIPFFFFSFTPSSLPLSLLTVPSTYTSFLSFSFPPFCLRSFLPFHWFPEFFSPIAFSCLSRCLEALRFSPSICTAFHIFLPSAWFPLGLRFPFSSLFQFSLRCLVDSSGFFRLSCQLVSVLNLPLSLYAFSPFLSAWLLPIITIPP